MEIIKLTILTLHVFFFFKVQIGFSQVDELWLQLEKDSTKCIVDCERINTCAPNSSKIFFDDTTCINTILEGNQAPYLYMCIRSPGKFNLNKLEIIQDRLVYFNVVAQGIELIYSNNNPIVFPNLEVYLGGQIDSLAPFVEYGSKLQVISIDKLSNASNATIVAQQLLKLPSLIAVELIVSDEIRFSTDIVPLCRNLDYLSMNIDLGKPNNVAVLAQFKHLKKLKASKFSGRNYELFEMLEHVEEIVILKVSKKAKSIITTRYPNVQVGELLQQKTCVNHFPSSRP